VRRQLGTYFKERRIELGLTQEEVAQKAGISERWYRKFEKNEQKPGVATTHAICRALHISNAESRSIYFHSITSEKRLLKITR
jgi:transcriptional regulator with XRE-family HTH domain